MSLLDDGDDDLFLSVDLAAASARAAVARTPATSGAATASDGDGDGGVNGVIDVDRLPSSRLSSSEVVDVDGGPHVTPASGAACPAAGAAEGVDDDGAAGDALSRTLHQYFGYSSFRPGQRGVIEAVLSGRDTCVFWATGAGKSLCFILPALLNRRRVVVVVSPLISLMVDQAAKINATIGGSVATPLATYLGSAQADAGEEAAAMAGERPVVFLSPEKVMDGATVPRLDALRRSGRLALIAIDEAHCILQWGEAFRKDYGCLTGLRGSLPGVPLMALTATAAPDHRADICSLLHLHDPHVAAASFDRTNLALCVQTLDAGADGKAAVVDRLAAELLVRPESTIIYVMTRKHCEAVHETLTQRVRRARPTGGAARGGGPSAAPVRVRRYHAGLSLAERAETHRQFAQGIATVVVATVAFGMGIDRPDVRSIVMLGPPKTVAEYMQQAGRAGRDGRPARCLMVASQADFSAYLSNFYMKGLSAQSKVAMAASVEALRNYAHDTSVCRRVALMRLYGETPSFDRCPPGTGACDVCNPPPVGSVPARRVRGRATGGGGPVGPVVMNRAALVVLLCAADGPAAHGYSRPSIIHRTQDNGRIDRRIVSPDVVAAERACVAATRRARAAAPAGTPLDVDYFRSIFNAVVEAGLLRSGASDTKYAGPRRPPVRYATFPLTPAGRDFLAHPGTAPLPAAPPPSAGGGPMRELVEAGIDAMAVLPSSEVAAGSGPILAIYLDWARSLATAPAVGPASRARLHVLLSAVHGWRDAAAEAAGVSPEELLPSHLAVAVATARPASVAGLRACGVRAAGLDDLVAVLDDWRAGKGGGRAREPDGGAMDDPILSDDEGPAPTAGRWRPRPSVATGGPPPPIEMASAVAARLGVAAAGGPAGGGASLTPPWPASAATAAAVGALPAEAPPGAPSGRRPRAPRASRAARLPRQPREGPAAAGHGSRAAPPPCAAGPAAAVPAWAAAAERGDSLAGVDEEGQGPKRRRV